MDNLPRVLRIYTRRDGLAPFSTWLDALKDTQGRQVIRARLKRLELGSFGDCKGVGSGVMKLRIDSGPGYRVYFALEGREIILLLCGGSKRTQSWDIISAKALWMEYRRRRDASER